MNDNVEKKIKYQFKVNNQMYESGKQIITGKEILEISMNIPTDRFRLDLKLKGGETKKIAIEDEVDLAMTGLEKFFVIPLGPQEG